MRMVVQKVERASVSVDGILRAEIGNGLMALVGLIPQDDDKVIDYMLDKLTNLRMSEGIFCLFPILHFTETREREEDPVISMRLHRKKRRRFLTDLWKRQSSCRLRSKAGFSVHT